MKFSPDRQARRPRGSRRTSAADVLDMRSNEPEEFSFDPARDIPPIQWERIERELHVLAQRILNDESKQGISVLSESIEKYLSWLQLISPSRVQGLVDNPKVKQVLFRGTKYRIGQDFTSDWSKAAYLSWLYPEGKDELVDPKPTSWADLTKRMKSGRDDKLSLFHKASMLDHVRSSQRDLGLYTQDSLTLVNLFPDGKESLLQVLATRGETAKNFAQKNIDGLKYYPEAMFVFSLIFPETREFLRVQPEVVAELKAKMKSDEDIGWSEYLKVVMAYAVLAAEEASLDYRGIHFKLSPPKLSKKPPQLPERNLT